jgi:type I restriction enzyme S subunit
MQQLFPQEGESVPRLRFEGFKGDWAESTLDKLANRITQKNKAGTVIRVLTNSALYGILDQRDYFDKDIANPNNLEGYYVVDKYDYVYNPRVSTIAPVGPISKNKIGKGVMSPLYTVFKNKNNDFYEQFFKSTYWHSYLKTISNNGARHDRMSITPDVFLDMPLPEPSPPEQQKIAACLSTLDDLITAQVAYIATLKQHKKGLMQQLFPSSDEATV